MTEPVLEVVVAGFIAERSQYVTALKNSRCDGDGPDIDYWRWQGHAEARRQLAEQLGMEVPY